MERTQRFRAESPCPVCGGHASLPQHEGRRCYGFISEDGRFAHCTREQFAHGLTLISGSSTFAHLLQGPCHCGKLHSTTSEARSISTSSTSSARRPKPPVDSYRHPQLGEPSEMWPYYDALGTLTGYAARFELPEGSKAIRPLVPKGGGWNWEGIPPPRPLYNLLELQYRPDAPILVVEGERTADAAGTRFPTYVPVTSMGGARAPKYTDWTPLRERHVVIWPDNDGDGLQYAKEVARLARAAGAATINLVSLPEGLPAHWDLADPVPDHIDLKQLLNGATPLAPDDSEEIPLEGSDGQVRHLSMANQLLLWAKEHADLYADGMDTFADVWIDGYRETWPLNSRAFKRWLRHLFFERTGKGVAHEALKHAIDNLDSYAARAGQRRVFLRRAIHSGKSYLDLGDDGHNVVEVDSTGWRLLAGPPPVPFRRSSTMRPLPRPALDRQSEGLQELRRFLNVENHDFVLCAAWLLAALRDIGPYPVLALTGEHGTAKSTAAKILRALVDPAHPATRGIPRDERDAAIATRNCSAMVFDNVSGLPTWFSDLLCRFSTGEGFSTRALRTDGDEFVIDACLPVIITSIGNVVVRGDLADRTLVIRLEPITDSRRRSEATLLGEFEEARPRILGALLDGLSEGFRQLPHIRLERIPRMADFAIWATACEGAFWSAGTFMAAYEQAQASATEDVLEDSQVWQAIRTLVKRESSFSGTASELLDQLNAERQEGRIPKGWPSTGPCSASCSLGWPLQCAS